MKASSDWFQFGEATSIPKSKHFQENIKAQFQIKFNHSIIRFIWLEQGKKVSKKHLNPF